MKNIAVVGCGHWGKNLVRNFYELGCLASICDPDTSLAKKISQQYNIPSNSYEEIINNSEIKGVVLAVPAPLHASLAIKAMSAGKHVYVEKPLAMNRVEAEAIIASAEENGVQLMVGHLLQYHPVFVSLKKIVKSGELGDLKYLYSNRLSFGKVRSEEDVIWSFAPHDISMILSLVGQEPERLRAESACILQDGIADTATIHMEFGSNLKGHVAVSWLHPFKEQKLVVVGEKAMAVFDDTHPWQEKLSVIQYEIDVTGKTPSTKKSDIEYKQVEVAEPLRQECKYFIALINGTVAPLTDGVEGLKVLKVLESASLSLAENRTIVLDF